MTFLAYLTLMLSAGWSEPELIKYDGSPAYLLVDNNGVVWCQIHTSSFFYNSETTDWELETADAPFGGYRPCFDKGDTLWLFTWGGGWINYTRFDGKDWSSTQSFPENGEHPLITADSTNGVWLCFESQNKGWSIACNRYRNGEWEEVQLVSDTIEISDRYFGSVTTDSYGRVWAAWEKKVYMVCDTIQASYYDGDGWVEPMSIAVRAYGDYENPQLAPDNEGGMWACWYSKHTDTAQYQIEASYWNGGTWSEADTIAQSGSSSSRPMNMIGVDTNGNAWAVWRQALKEEDDLGDIYYSVNCGSGWSEPEAVSAHPAFDGGPDIAVDGEGRIWCVWGSGRGDSAGIWASYTTGTGILEPVTPAPATPVTPSFTVDQAVGREFTFRVSNLDHPGVIHIYDASGRVVNSLEVNSGSALWDGRDLQGEMLSPGVYFVKPLNIPQVKRVVMIR